MELEQRLPPNKLQKRKSRERQELVMSGRLNTPSTNTSQAMAPPNNASSAEDKKKKSKFHLSNPFHSKEKDIGNSKKDPLGATEDNRKRDTLEPNGDSAYGSSEPSSSANPSFTHNPRPISGEQQWQTPPANSQAPIMSTPSPQQTSFAPPPAHALQNRSSHENISREAYRDAGTGNIVTTMTTTTTTTTTTTGPGGTTTVEQPVGNNVSQGGGSITNMSGPSPPSPMPPLPPSQNPVPGLTPQASRTDITPPMHANPNQYRYQEPPQQATIPENASPPIPQKNNIRNRLELDSVSPAIQRPNPMDQQQASPITPSSPSSRANFSYPSRAPPQGVPRQVSTEQQQPTSHQLGESCNSQQHSGYENESSHPVPFRAGHAPQQVPQSPAHKQSTLANLKAAAHGIHGAGEALRGTFNSTIDRRFATADSTVHAKNQATINAGRSEIDSQNFAYRPRPHATDAPPVPPIPTQQQYANSPAQQPYSGSSISGSQIDEGYGGGGGKLSGFMKKMKEGPMASNRSGGVGAQ
ncbi:hypothetical protein GQ44DRAFT_717535 [Phaeosphaeriaceae sp. PMI808]|nr:hypothetical protein GQ44DRAFT_717535 [Phaeosphaeriaceae sp. PMI808]